MRLTLVAIPGARPLPIITAEAILPPAMWTGTMLSVANLDTERRIDRAAPTTTGGLSNDVSIKTWLGVNRHPHRLLLVFGSRRYLGSLSRLPNRRALSLWKRSYVASLPSPR